MNILQPVYAFCLVLPSAVPTLSDTEKTQREIFHMGYVQDPQMLEIIASLGKEYLSDPILMEDETAMAKGILTYIGPDVVAHGRFVPPKDFYIPEQQLEVMRNKVFPDEGCRIERLIFAENSGFIVLLIDATDKPTEHYLTTCFLGAVLTALGAEIDGTPIQSIDNMDYMIRKIIN